MHRRFHKILLVLVSVIGSFCLVVKGQEVEPSQVHLDAKTNKEVDSQGQPVVQVDSMNAVQLDQNGKPMPIPYAERRGRWGTTISFGASTFVPSKFQPNFVASDYSSVYTHSMPLIETNIVIKRNLKIGSLGFEIGGGYAKNDSRQSVTVGNTVTPLDSAMEIALLRLGAMFSFDRLYRVPYVVPYVSGGAYSIYYRESRPSTAVSGNTQVAPYLTGGLMVQLDWLDPTSALHSYQETGLQNTFLYLELRTLLASASSSDPQMNPAAHFDMGLRAEF